MVAALVSQAIGRWLTKNNFYDALLEQDGQSVEQVIPPRDLRAWQEAPVSRIGNFRPVIVAGVDGRVIGIVTLHDLLRAEFALAASG
jgi:CIC family chloride channel protein